MFESIFDATPTLLAILNPLGTIERWNSVCEQLTGCPSGQAAGHRLDEFFIPFLERGENEPTNGSCHTPAGRKLWITWSYTRLPDPEGQQEYTLACGLDITAQRFTEEMLRQSEARARALAAISQSLADASLDFQAVLDAVVGDLASMIGDLAVIQLLSEDRSEIQTCAVHHKDPQRDARARDLLMVVHRSASTGLSARVIQTGMPVVIQDLPQEKLDQVDNPAWLPFLPEGETDLHNLLIVPLRAHGETFGVVSLSRSSAAPAYTVEDLNFVIELADRAALAIDNSRLYNDNFRQRDELELRVARRTTEISVINQYLQLQLTERRRLEEELSLFFDVTQDLLCLFTLDGFFSRLNPAWSKTLGWSEDELMGQPYLDFVHPADRAATIDAAARLADGYPLTGFDNRYRCKDGTYRWLSWNMIGLPKRGLAVAAARDITERKHAEQSLSDLLEFNQKIIANSPVGIFAYNPNGECILANESGARIIAAPLSDALQFNYHQIPSWQRSGLSRMADATLMKGEEQREEIHMLSANDQEAWLDCFLTRFHSGDENHLLVMVNDVTSRKRVEEELQHLATHDALTGLPNRHLFQDRLDLALARARRAKQRVAVMLLDLDHFKQINDTYGHQTGDLVLKVIADRLSGCLRKSDTVARMGGDEFTFIFPDMADPQHAEIVAAKILQTVSQPIDLGIVLYQPTASLGISFFPPHGENPETLLKNADIAMYQAKEWRNCYSIYACKPACASPVE